MVNGTGKRYLEMTFRTKLLLSLCGLVLLTGVTVIIVADRGNRANTTALVDSLFREVSSHAVTKTKDFIMRAAPVTQTLGQLANHGLAIDDMERLARQLLIFLKANAATTWVLYGDESGDYTGATRLRDGSIHIERTHIADGKTYRTIYEVLGDGSWKVLSKDQNSGYDPRKRPFYTLAKKKGKLSWTPPYMFFSQGVPGIACVIPVKNADGRLRGVFSVEFDLNALSEFVRQLSISEHSRVFIFTPDQTLVAHPNLWDMAGHGDAGQGALLTLGDTDDPLVEAFSQHLLPEYVRSNGGDEFHFFDFRHDGSEYLASTTVFQIGDGQTWVVGAIAPQSEFLSTIWRTRWLSLLAAAISLCIAALLAAALARRISNPVLALIGFMKRVGEGDLEARADLRGGREFGELSIALNQMIDHLRERLTLRASLQVAMEVQQSLLPAADPISPMLDVAGRSNYCDEVGGDYYDFIDMAAASPSSLLIAVGDVMGHGVPSALLMATARAALRTTALREHKLAELMTRTNQILAEDNRHKRFMTLCLLLIDAETRTVRWASAGHDPAIVYSPQTNSFQELDGGSLPLGILESTEYKEYTSRPLTFNSVIVIGTDGVWEMYNEKREQYGKDRLRRVVQENHARSAAEIAAALEADLAAHRGLQNPVDDVTFVIIKLLSNDDAAAAN
jgi:serine phosphatase RsbU (regulator of sigma subunit)